MGSHIHIHIHMDIWARAGAARSPLAAPCGAAGGAAEVLCGDTHDPGIQGFEFSMSDSEDWFHTKQACKKYIEPRHGQADWEQLVKGAEIMPHCVRVGRSGLT